MAIGSIAIPSSFAQTDFEDLFDGETLAGWEGSPKYWRVEDGAIVGEIPEGERLAENHWLIWEGGDVDDFELRLQFRLSGNPRANSGIQFRSQAEDISHVSGYQADLDQGAVWLGRIYDEHGRRLLVERGTRVQIDEDGNRQIETFADKDPYAVLFRENEWNDYRIIACGNSISVEINGTLFSELVDREIGERDRSGQLAFQLHSGLHTVVEFRDVRLRKLQPGDHEVTISPDSTDTITTGIVPTDASGRSLNLGFENGNLEDWTVEGEAFDNQPATVEPFADRLKLSDGTYSIVGSNETSDTAVGLLTSVPFKILHPWASLLVGGGGSRHTQVEVVLNDEKETVIHVFRGRNQGKMRRAYFDLTPHLGKEIFVRLRDYGTRPGSHVNYDDFRFYSEQPKELRNAASERVRENPILSHLVPNPVETSGNGAFTLNGMSVAPGFNVERVAAEPDLHQPIAFTFDARGRLWVIEAYSYPTKRSEGEGLDRIVIFEDKEGDGHFESRKVFTEGLNLASGLEVGHGGVWVGAAPELLFIPDQDGNDIPDSDPVVLLDGFGYQDTHETLNSFIWGPDGWLYGLQGIFNYAKIGKPGASDDDRVSLSAGVWRYHPTRHEFEIFGYGGSNPWGIDFNEMGQLFMTHCRSRWGGGPVTHVIQGGHYWNQANRGHADFVSGRAPPGFGVFRNYLLASARYGHGEGGAGKPGSRAVYGGHSLVGSMIYLGDNWPAEYRDHLFSHNLHGHQLNHMVNLSEGSGYNTIHAGKDLLYSPDPTYVAVELKYGPDGAVYLSDWVDTQHCHNPNSEQWDRGNGRLYRMSWAETYQPVKVDLEQASDSELVAYQLHSNDWYVRTARRLLRERANERSIDLTAAATLIEMALENEDSSRRLRAAWALLAIGKLSDPIASRLLRDSNEYVRAWTIQLLTDDRSVSERLRNRLVEMADSDESPFVRLYLASAIQRLPSATAWALCERLSQKPEDATDRYLPKMVWYGMAPLMASDPSRALNLAENSAFPSFAHYANWYGAKLQGDALEQVLDKLAEAANPQPVLEAVALGLQGQLGLAMPTGWSSFSSKLYNDENPRVVNLALELGSLFGDQSIYPKLRAILTDTSVSLTKRQAAFSALANSLDPSSVPLLASLIDDPDFREDAIRLSPRLNQPDIAERLLDRFDSFSESEQTTALAALTQKESFAQSLLDAMHSGKLDRSLMTAYYARALGNLNSPVIDEKLKRVWGAVNAPSQDLLGRIDEWEKRYSEAPLWAFNTLSGKSHFNALCASCHQPSPTGATIGPDLRGSGSNGARYFFENIIDPNAVVGSDYAISVVKTKSGQTLSGILDQQTETAVTIKTLTETTTIPRGEIASIETLNQSIMPPGLLDSLEEREVIELVKYLESL